MGKNFFFFSLSLYKVPKRKHCELVTHSLNMYMCIDIYIFFSVYIYIKKTRYLWFMLVILAQGRGGQSA